MDVKWHWRRPALTTPLAGIIPRMTLVEVTYNLHTTPSMEQLRRLGEFANLYGLRRFRVDEQHNRLTFEYDASRLRDTQVAHLLGQAGIAVADKANSLVGADPIPVDKATLPMDKPQ
jgi:hypothetical protein